MRTLRTSMAAVAAALILGASACGGSSHAKVASISDGGSSNASSSSSSDEKKDIRDAMLDFARCMREHGVDMPDPTFTEDGSGGGAVGVLTGKGANAPDPDSATFKAAQAACQPILDAAKKDFTPPSPEEQAKMRDQALKFAQCMRDKGFDVPDPTFDSDGGMSIQKGPDDSSGGNTGPAAPDPAFREAAKACSAQEGGGPGMVLDQDGGK
jgi:hypothetical protein